MSDTPFDPGVSRRDLLKTGAARRALAVRRAAGHTGSGADAEEGRNATPDLPGRSALTSIPTTPLSS